MRTREALKSEAIKFKTRTTPYDAGLTDYEALNKFVARIENLAMSELSEWCVAHVRESTTEGKKGPLQG